MRNEALVAGNINYKFWKLMQTVSWINNYRLKNQCYLDFTSFILNLTNPFSIGAGGCTEDVGTANFAKAVKYAALLQIYRNVYF